jgi:hypothetical protein
MIIRHIANYRDEMAFENDIQHAINGILSEHAVQRKLIDIKYTPVAAWNNEKEESEILYNALLIFS